MHPELDRLLTARGLRCWAYLTAHNPNSEAFAADENQRRHGRLETHVSARGYGAFPGEGVGDDQTWPPEASLLILGIPRSEAMALGLAHGQRAVVWGELGEPALLLLCSQGSAAEP